MCQRVVDVHMYDASELWTHTLKTLLVNLKIVFQHRQIFCRLVINLIKNDGDTHTLNKVSKRLMKAFCCEQT